MIKSIHATNLLGIEKADIELGRVTALYGHNGSAKSSVADALLFALTGEAVRGGTLPELIRQGAKAAEVEVVLSVDGEDLSVIRRRTKSTGEVFLNGAATSVSEAQATLRRALGASAATVRAAMQSGAILGLDSAGLQALLQALTGAQLDESAIKAAFEQEVVEAATRRGLTLPTALTSFDAAAKRAEGARQMAKRNLKEIEADLERMPARGPESWSREALESALDGLAKRREQMVAEAARQAGMTTERARSLQERLEALPSGDRPERDGAGYAAASEQLLAVSSRLEVAKDKLSADSARLDEARIAAQGGERDDRLLGRAAEVEAQLAAAVEQRAGAKAKLAGIIEEGKRRKELLERLPKAGCIGPCPVLPETTCPISDLSELESKLRAAREEALVRYRAAKAELDGAESTFASVNDHAREIGEARKRAKALERIEELEKLVANERLEADRLADELAALEPRVEALKAERDAFDAWRRRAAERSKLESELAEAGAPVEVRADDELEAIDAEVAKLQRNLADAGQQERRARVEAAVAEERRAVEDTDLVAKACGAGGVRARLLGRMVSPFLNAANAALALLAPDYSVVISDDFALQVRTRNSVLRPAQLSDGEQTRMRYVLQYAVAKLAKLPVLVLDRSELLDATGKAALRRLIAECGQAEMQVVMLSSAEPPSEPPPGAAVYVMEAGRSRRVCAG